MNAARIGAVAMLVRDYDEAKLWFADVLGFGVVEDVPLEADKRWLVVTPPGGGTALLLAKACGAAQQARIGDQAGGRVWLFLHTDDFSRDYERMRTRRVVFEEPPRRETYGIVAVFRDLYGNRWDLIEPA